MTDRDALIKELQHMVDTGEWGAGTMRKAIQALSAPGDAEREELAKLADRCIEYASMFGFTKREVSQFKLIGADLRRPVKPMVTDEKGLREAICRGLDAYRKADATHIQRFRADYVLKEVKAFLSQPAGGGK